MKIKKRFEYEGVELKIVEREESYMNSDSTLTMTRVLAPNGGVVPVTIQHRQTLKSIVSETIRVLNGFKKRGCDVQHELTRADV